MGSRGPVPGSGGTGREARGTGFVLPGIRFARWREYRQRENRPGLPP